MDTIQSAEFKFSLEFPSSIQNASAVLISGPMGAGKSTIAEAVRGVTGGICFSLDEFFLDAPAIEVEYLPDIGWHRLWDSPTAYDWELFESCLRELLTKGNTIVPQYSFDVNRRVGESQMFLPQGSQIIVDGVYGFRASSVLDVLGMSAVRVFVTAELSLRFSRVLRRDALAWRNYPEHAPKRIKALAAADERWILRQQSAADIVIDTSYGFPNWAVQQTKASADGRSGGTVDGATPSGGKDL
jgi:uridine kinase